MGKTKTAFVSEVQKEQKSSEEKYREKKERQEKVHIAGLKGGQRVKIVEAEPIPTTEEQIENKSEEGKKKEIQPKVRGKKYQENYSKVDKIKLYSLPEAVELVQKTSYSKFDGTIELHLVVKKVGISAQVSLPFQAGKEKKIEFATEETIKKISQGKIDFDVLIATAEMMPKLVPFARTLGPKGLMPNPKNGTLVKSEKDAKKFSGNTLNLKTEKDAPLIHTKVGKVSQKAEEIIKNTEAILGSLGGSKQIMKAFMKATMGPSVKVALS